jgi:hypothetical protein
MNKREKYITLELSGDNLDKFVVDLREKILTEFWPKIPDGDDREMIKSRLEKSILNALESESSETP